MIREINLRQKADDSHAAKLTTRNQKAISNKRKETKIKQRTCCEENGKLLNVTEGAMSLSIMGPAYLAGCHYAMLI